MQLPRFLVAIYLFSFIETNRNIYEGNQKYVSGSLSKSLTSSSELDTNCSCNSTVQDSFTRTADMIALQKNHVPEGSSRPIDAVGLAQPNSTKASQKHDKYDSKSAKHTEGIICKLRLKIYCL